MSRPASVRADSSDWSNVTQLPSGAEITLETTRVFGQLYVVSADHSSITVVSPAHRALPSFIRDELRTAARQAPGSLLAAIHSVRFIHPEVSIGPAGLFNKDRKLADLYEVVFKIPRSEVVQISRRQLRGSRWGALAGGLVGIAVGVPAGLSQIYSDCGGSCTGEGTLMLLSFIGLPIAGAVGGYHLIRTTTDVITYRAPLR